MTIAATAHAGESLDSLVWRAIGAGAAAVERTLAANPGLAALALALPEGTEVRIPVDAAAPATNDTINLWD